MLAVERRTRILDAARRDGTVRIADLVMELGVSQGTVRRDVEALVTGGLLDKVHGGAMARSASATVEYPDRASQRAPHVGVVVPTAYYFRSIVDGVRSVLDAADARLTLSISAYDTVDERRLIDEQLKAGARGLLLAPTIGGTELDPEYAEYLNALPVPTVLLERDLPGHGLSALSTVRSDHERGASAAVDHLFDFGHRRQALVSRGNTRTADLVRRGWQASVQRLGLPADLPNLSGRDLGTGPDWDVGVLDDLVRRLREAGTTGLLVHGDADVLAIRQHVQRCGLVVPDMLSIITYDDEFAGLSDPPLTAVAPSKKRVGQLAAQALLELLDQDLEPTVAHTVVEPKLIIRQSVVSPPGVTPQ